jgi:hypothetical protein
MEKNVVTNFLKELNSARKRLAKIREAKKYLEEEARKHEESQTGTKKRGRKPKAPDATVKDDAKVNVTEPSHSEDFQRLCPWLQCPGCCHRESGDCSL